MSQYDNTNKGIISKNTRKELDTHPDIKGQINIEGTEYWLDGWQKQRTDGSGSFYSLSVKPKNAPAAPAKPAPQRSKPAPASSRFDDMDDDIPF
jgi:single-stranded DNA-binding protein